MSRPSRPWLLPGVCAVLGVGWVLWLAHESEPDRGPSPAPTPVNRSTPASPPGGPLAVNPAESPSEVHPASIPQSAARSADKAPASTPSAVQLTFQTPAGARVGESFDIRVSIVASQPIANVAVEVNYDPALLKARTVEEIDYAQRTVGERAFRIEDINDGRATLSMSLKGVGLPVNVPLVQMEALSPGGAQIRIDSINVSDPSGRPLTWSAFGQESGMSLN